MLFVLSNMSNNNTAAIFVAVPAILLLLLQSFFSSSLPSVTMAQQITATTTPPLTPQEQEQQNRLQNEIAATTRNLENGQKQVNGVVYTPRWPSNPVSVEPGTLSILFAYCLPGEFADSGQEILGGSELEVLESYSLALTSNLTGWFMVVENEDTQNRLPAAVGVICASDANDAQVRVLSPGEQQEINNIIQQFTTIQNTQVTNIDQVINIINNVTSTTTQNGTGGGRMTAPTNDTGTTTGQPLTVEILPNGTQGVFPTTFRFEASVAGGTEPYTYSWDTNYGAITGVDVRGNEKAFEFVNPVPGTYNVTVTVTDSKNQTGSDSIQITVEPPESPTVEIISNGTQGVAPATFRFEMNVNPSSNPLTWYWDFGDGEYIEQRGEERTVEHTFEQAGTYNVVLRLLAAGGFASDSIQITVEPPEPPTGGGGGERGPQGGVTVDSTEEEPGLPSPEVP
jgi:PKD repeat protein